jgi:hypothetical protein
VVELRQLRHSSPHLASAIDLQLAVLEAQRLMQSRVPLPRVYGKDDVLTGRLRAGRRLIEFDDIAFDWSDARRLVRDAAELLRRFELVDNDEAAEMTALVRDAQELPLFLRAWYDRPVRDADADALSTAIEAGPGAGQVCLLAMRPYLARCAAAVAAFVDQRDTASPSCPVCAGEPDFTVWSARGRTLVCGRCTARWAYPDERCGFCGDADARARKSFASHSRTYRVEACERCRRYLKGFDERRSVRPVILSVDAIATLPLDAAALQLGFE